MSSKVGARAELPIRHEHRESEHLEFSELSRTRLYVTNPSVMHQSVVRWAGTRIKHRSRSATRLPYSCAYWTLCMYLCIPCGMLTPPRHLLESVASW